MRKTIVPILLGVLLLLFACWLQLTPQTDIKQWRLRLNYIAYDVGLNTGIKKYSPEKNPVAIVFIDDKSLKEEGRWPWPRAKLATLTEQLKKLGAVVIAFDIIFPEPEDNNALQITQALQQQQADPTSIEAVKKLVPQFDNDAVLRQALLSADTVLGFVFHNKLDATEGLLPQPFGPIDIPPSMQPGVMQAESYSSNIPMLQTAAKAGGFINDFPDFDGVVRRVPVVMNYKNMLYPSLALAAAKLYLLSDNKITWERIGNQMMVDTIQLGKQIIPVDNRGQALIPFIDPTSFAQYSAIDVIENKIPASAFAGKLVFLGVSAPGLGDLQATPIESALPGVVVNAALARGILVNNFNYVPSWAKGAEILVLVLVGLLCALLFPLMSAEFLIASTLLGPILLFLANMFLLKETGVVLLLAVPMLLIIAMGLLNMTYGYFSEERRRESLRVMFGQYVAPAYIEKLLQQPEAGLQSETKEMTVLFSDIRNFTTISETMLAADIKAVLNQFFTPMTEIIFKHGGTIDKYVGDMIMAFWGAPLADNDHAKHALAAALEMQAMAAKLKEEFVKKGLPAISIGIGINTGSMSVGDMGSQFRRAYTVIGDAVNLASRLESLTKAYHVGIIAGPSTKAAGESDFIFKEIGSVEVKGKALPVTAYELVGHVSTQQS